MHTDAHLRLLKGAGIRRVIAIALPGLLVVSLAAIPTSSAAAGTASPSVVSSGGVSLNVPVGQLESIASSLPVSDLGLNSTELEKLLTTIPGLTGLSSVQELLMQTLVSTLGPTATVNGLLEGVLSALGVHVTPAELFSALEGTAQNPTEVAKVLGDLAGGLTPTQLTQLQGLLGPLVSALSSGELGQLQSVLDTLLGGLGTGKLQTILGSLEGALSGSGLAQLQSLIGNLGSLTPSQLQTQLQELLGGLSSAQLSALLTQLFGSLNPTQLQTVLGGLLGGLSFSPKTAGELAGTLGEPLEQLATDVGVTAENLPASLTTLTAPLANGELLSLLNGLGGLSLSVLGGPGKQGSEGSGGSGGSSGQGTGGGNGGSGGSGTPGTTSVVVTTPPVTVVSPGQSAPAKAAAKKLAKIKIISHKVKGRVATFVVQVPAGGRVTLSGSGVKSASHTVNKAGRVTLKVTLSKAGTASLRKHRNRLKVKLKAAFKPGSGAGSTASQAVTFV